MDKRFWAIIGVIVVIFGGIIFLNNHSSKNNNSSKNSGTPTSHIAGNTTSKVKLIEYGDYECPVCENYQATVQQVGQKYNDTVAFQFRNLPLSQIHPNAFAGARAAEAAAKQGKFWEMHDLLYTPQDWQEWSTSNNATPYFKQYAGALKLNLTQFNKDFSSAAVNNLINADIAAFEKTGQPKATPSFFLNGKYIANTKLVDASGQPSLDAFSKVIDNALKTTK
ncbi:MAG TPA: thioredoxin domain-containing protein [Candidatus Saccharimonadales bacterium]|nr:thioredoxin domain-containing protein [Candidatus Saccharimonadales bacterium]